MLLPQRPYHAVTAAALYSLGRIEDRGGLPVRRGGVRRPGRGRSPGACPSRIAYPRIHSEDNWSQRLSGGEQQRLAIARASRQADWLFLDEAALSLDETLEAEIYRMLSAVLPNTTIVSIGHRSTLIALRPRHVEMEPGRAGIFEPTPTTGVGVNRLGVRIRFSERSTSGGEP
jgi:hypothetical protein